MFCAHQAIDFDPNHPVDLFSFLGQTESVLVIVIKIWIKLYTLYITRCGWFMFAVCIFACSQALCYFFSFFFLRICRYMAFAYALILQRAEHFMSFDIWNNRCFTVRKKWKNRSILVTLSGRARE